MLHGSLEAGHGVNHTVGVTLIHIVLQGNGFTAGIGETVPDHIEVPAAKAKR
jgi:hypothetical protein